MKEQGEGEQTKKETGEKTPLAFQLKKEKKPTCKVVRPNKGSSAELCTHGPLSVSWLVYSEAIR